MMAPLLLSFGHCSRHFAGAGPAGRTCTLPHGRCGPLPSTPASAVAPRPGPVVRVPPRAPRLGRRPRVGELGGARQLRAMDSGRADRARARRRARDPHAAAEAHPGLLAAATIRTAPPAAPRLAR